MQEVLSLDFTELKPIEIPVKGLLGKDYILKEASAGAGLTFRGTLAGNITYGPSGKPNAIDGKIVGAEPAVLGSCLYEVLQDGSTAKTPVGTEFIKRLPDGIQSTLFEKLKEITPTLYGPKKDTVVSLTKEIERLEAKRSKLQEQGDETKNS